MVFHIALPWVFSNPKRYLEFENDQQLEVIQRLQSIDPDSLSPRDAQALIYELKRLID